MTTRRLQAAGFALVINVLTLFALAGSSRLSGPTVWAMNERSTHGIHRDDLIVAACWLVGMVLCVLLARGERPDSDS